MENVLIGVMTLLVISLTVALFYTACVVHRDAQQYVELQKHTDYLEAKDKDNTARIIDLKTKLMRLEDEFAVYKHDTGHH